MAWCRAWDLGSWQALEIGRLRLLITTEEAFTFCHPMKCSRWTRQGFLHPAYVSEFLGKGTRHESVKHRSLSVDSCVWFGYSGLSDPFCTCKGGLPDGEAPPLSLGPLSCVCPVGSTKTEWMHAALLSASLSPFHWQIEWTYRLLFTSRKDGEWQEDYW